MWRITDAFLALLNVGATIFIMIAAWGKGLGWQLWNLAPLALGYIWLLVFWMDSSFPLPARLAVSGYVIGSAGFTLLIGVYWVFDIDEFATGSSTSVLIFIFSPMWALAFGFALAGIVYLMTRLIVGKRGAQSGSSIT